MENDTLEILTSPIAEFQNQNNTGSFFKDIIKDIPRSCYFSAETKNCFPPKW